MPTSNGIGPYRGPPRHEPEVAVSVAADPAVTPPTVYITDGPLTPKHWAEISARDIVRVRSPAGQQLRLAIVDALIGLFQEAGRSPMDGLVAEGVKRVKFLISHSQWASQFIPDQATVDLTDILIRHFETAATAPRE